MPDDFSDKEAGQEPFAGGSYRDGVALSPERDDHLAPCCVTRRWLVCLPMAGFS